MFFDQYAALCKAAGKTPNGVAKELGLPSSSVTQWRQGGTPRPQTLQKIADYFSVSVEYLLTGAGPGDIKKERPADSEALTDMQKTTIDLVKSMSDADLKLFLDILKTVRENSKRSE